MSEERSTVYAEVQQVIVESRGSLRTPSWIAQAVLSLHPDIHGDDAEWHRVNSLHALKSLALRACREAKGGPNTDAQILLPGYEHLQIEYAIPRGLVPIEEMSDDELDEKILELEQMSVGCLKHAEELRRFKKDRRRARRA